MPQVPRDDRQVQVGAAPQVRQTPDAPLEAFGGGSAVAQAGRAVNSVGEGVTKMYEQEREAAKSRVFFDKDLQLSEQQAKLELAVKNMRGKNAAASTEFVDTEWNKATAEITKDLSPEQRGWVMGAANVRRANLNKFTNKHASTELNKYDDDQTAAYIKQAQSEAQRHPDDPNRLELSIVQQEAAIEKNAEKYGLSTQDVAIKKEVARSSTKLAVLESIVDSDDPDKDLKAKAFYDRNKDSFRFDDIEKAHKRVEAATKLGEAYRASDGIFSSSKNLTEALGQARKIQDPNTRKAVTEELSNRFTLKERAEKQKDDDLYDMAGNIIDKTGSYDKIPQNVLEQLSVPMKSSLKAYAKQKNSGAAIAPNGDKYIDLTLMASNPATRQAFAEMSMSQLRGQMTDSEHKELIKLQAGILKGDGKTASLLGSVETTNQMLTRSLKTAKIDPASEDGRQFFRVLNRKINEQATETGVRPKGPEIQSMVDGLLYEGVQEKRSFLGFDSLAGDVTKRAYQLKEGESFVEVGDTEIPADEKAKIVDFLKRKKQPVTDANILKWFNAKFGGG
jgi:hypothetical protein